VEQASLDRRYRNKNGRIARKYGNTYIRTLRVRYGGWFALGERAEGKLIDVLHKLDDLSLSRLIEELSGHTARRSENAPLPSPRLPTTTKTLPRLEMADETVGE
jgi:hypothetical protein